MAYQFTNGILLHSGLIPDWHLWLSTRFSCCLKVKSVQNILGYIREQFYRFSRGCKPRENLWNCSRKYTEMFKTDSFLGHKKLTLNQNVWLDHATMQRMFFCPFSLWLCKNEASISTQFISEISCKAIKKGHFPKYKPSAVAKKKGMGIHY